MEAGGTAPNAGSTCARIRSLTNKTLPVLGKKLQAQKQHLAGGAKAPSIFTRVSFEGCPFPDQFDWASFFGMVLHSPPVDTVHFGTLPLHDPQVLHALVLSLRRERNCCSHLRVVDISKVELGHEIVAVVEEALLVGAPGARLEHFLSGRALSTTAGRTPSSTPSIDAHLGVQNHVSQRVYSVSHDGVGSIPSRSVSRMSSSSVVVESIFRSTPKLKKDTRGASTAALHRIDKEHNNEGGCSSGPRKEEGKENITPDDEWNGGIEPRRGLRRRASSSSRLTPPATRGSRSATPIDPNRGTINQYSSNEAVTAQSRDPGNIQHQRQHNQQQQQPSVMFSPPNAQPQPRDTSVQPQQYQQSMLPVRSVSTTNAASQFSPLLADDRQFVPPDYPLRSVSASSQRPLPTPSTSNDIEWPLKLTIIGCQFFPGRHPYVQVFYPSVSVEPALRTTSRVGSTITWNESVVLRRSSPRPVNDVRIENNDLVRLELWNWDPKGMNTLVGTVICPLVCGRHSVAVAGPHVDANTALLIDVEADGEAPSATRQQATVRSRWDESQRRQLEHEEAMENAERMTPLRNILSIGDVHRSNDVTLSRMSSSTPRTSHGPHAGDAQYQHESRSVGRERGEDAHYQEAEAERAAGREDVSPYGNSASDQHHGAAGPMVDEPHNAVERPMNPSKGASSVREQRDAVVEKNEARTPRYSANATQSEVETEPIFGRTTLTIKEFISDTTSAVHVKVFFPQGFHKPVATVTVAEGKKAKSRRGSRGDGSDAEEAFNETLPPSQSGKTSSAVGEVLEEQEEAVGGGDTSVQPVVLKRDYVGLDDNSMLNHLVRFDCYAVYDPSIHRSSSSSTTDPPSHSFLGVVVFDMRTVASDTDEVLHVTTSNGERVGLLVVHVEHDRAAARATRQIHHSSRSIGTQWTTEGTEKLQTRNQQQQQRGAGMEQAAPVLVVSDQPQTVTPRKSSTSRINIQRQSGPVAVKDVNVPVQSPRSGGDLRVDSTATGAWSLSTSAAAAATEVVQQRENPRRPARSGTTNDNELVITVAEAIKRAEARLSASKSGSAAEPKTMRSLSASRVSKQRSPSYEVTSATPAASRAAPTTYTPSSWRKDLPGGGRRSASAGPKRPVSPQAHHPAYSNSSFPNNSSMVPTKRSASASPRPQRRSVSYAEHQRQITLAAYKRSLSPSVAPPRKLVVAGPTPDRGKRCAIGGHSAFTPSMERPRPGVQRDTGLPQWADSNEKARRRVEASLPRQRTVSPRPRSTALLGSSRGSLSPAPQPITAPTLSW